MESVSRPVVQFQDVSYAIDGATILDGLSFEVTRGEVLVLLGESGCGKTTTLKLINRLIEPTTGEILVDGRSTMVWDVIDLRRSVGYVLQDGGLFPHMTVGDNVGLTLRLRDERPASTCNRVNKMLELVGLEPAKFTERFPHELSGGQRQRVGVARALASDPALLLLDEPFGDLDALTRAKLQKEFAALVRELGKTAIFVTHDLHEAMLLATRIAMMDKGRIVLLDDADGFRLSDIPLVCSYLETVLTRA